MTIIIKFKRLQFNKLNNFIVVHIKFIQNSDKYKSKKYILYRRNDKNFPVNKLTIFVHLNIAVI